MVCGEAATAPRCNLKGGKTIFKNGGATSLGSILESYALEPPYIAGLCSNACAPEVIAP